MQTLRLDNEVKAIMEFDGSAIKVITATPVKCRCGRMAAMFVNREGQTRCWECDNELIRKRELFLDDPEAWYLLRRMERAWDAAGRIVAERNA